MNTSFKELKKVIKELQTNNLVFVNGVKKWDINIDNHVIRFTWNNKTEKETYRYSNTILKSWRIFNLEVQVFLEITIKLFNYKSEPYFITDIYEIQACPKSKQQ